MQNVIEKICWEIFLCNIELLEKYIKIRIKIKMLEHLVIYAENINCIFFVYIISLTSFNIERIFRFKYFALNKYFYFLIQKL